MVLKISRQQMKSFELRAAEQWDQTVAEELADLYRPYFQGFGVTFNQIVQFCHLARDYAAAYAVEERRDVFRMIVIALALGAHFPHDCRYRNMVSIYLGDVSAPSGRRLATLGREVEEILQRRSYASARSSFGVNLARLLALAGPSIPNTQITHSLIQLPGFGNETGHEILPVLVADCLSYCDRAKIRAPYKRLAYCACALVHGVYWFDDPLLDRLRELTLAADTKEAFSADLCAFYEALS